MQVAMMARSGAVLLMVQYCCVTKVVSSLRLFIQAFAKVMASMVARGMARELEAVGARKLASRSVMVAKAVEV